jgi:zinc transporter ZupT
VPEGLATATVLRGRGKAPLAAVFVAFAATAPQALTAPLAFLFSASLGTASFAFVGFAAEKMLWIALTELLPDALLACESKFQTEKVAAVASLSALAIAVACSAL